MAGYIARTVKTETFSLKNGIVKFFETIKLSLSWRTSLSLLWLMRIKMSRMVWHNFVKCLLCSLLCKTYGISEPVGIVMGLSLHRWQQYTLSLTFQCIVWVIHTPTEILLFSLVCLITFNENDKKKTMIQRSVWQSEF